MTARMGLDTSARAMVARAVGANEISLANHVALQSFTLSTSISLLAATLGILFTEFLLRLIGVSDAVIAQGANYMRWTFVASATMAFMWMGSSVLQAAGDTLTPMKAQVASRIIHIGLSPLLMFGWIGFPEWGLAGAAIANAIAQLLGAGINFYALFTGTSRLHLSFSGYRVDGPLLWRMVTIGAPASVTGMERALAQLILVGLVTPFGDVALAAYSLTNRVQMIANLGSMGVGQAAGTMVGQALGAKKPERAKSAVLWALAYTTLLKGIVIGLIVLFPAFFLSIFSEDAELLGTAQTWLYIQAVGFFAMGASMVFMQSFNTAGDTMVPMVVTLISMWAVQQPLAIMLSGVAIDWSIFGWVIPVPTIANLGQYGIAWAVVIAIAVRLLIYVPYFIWGPWTKKQVLGGGRGGGMGMGMRGGH
jgi:putative MATE family efflux protein